MTCIVGMKIGKRVIIGGDSAGSTPNYVEIRKDEKVFKIDDFIFGATTSFRMIQLIRYSFKPPQFKPAIGFQTTDGGIDLYRYMCTSFIDGLRTCFKAGGFLMKEADGQEFGGMFLVGYHDNLFKIGSDFQVAEVQDDFTSVGCGCDFALGAMKVLSENTKLDSMAIATKALDVAAYYSPYVRPPFNFVST